MDGSRTPSPSGEHDERPDRRQRRRARGLWLRWSLRDLRSRWPLVTAIALIIAVGTGTFAGLGSTAVWRRQSNDASFATLHMHDLRVTLPEGASLPAGDLTEAVEQMPHRRWVTGSVERLVGSTQVDASHDGETVLTPGRIVGAPPAGHDAPTATGAPVDTLHVSQGRALAAADDGQPVAVLEQKYADHFDLPDHGQLTVSGARRLDYVGTGVQPQDFVVTGIAGTLFAEADLAVLYVPLATAQDLLGRPGQVNELVLTVDGGADVALLERELDEALGDVGATYTTRDDEPAVRMLYEDIDTDQQLWNVLAGLVLLGATFAAFNLTSRMVDAQRRELGVGMALGMRPRRLAVRPLLVGTQIALLGVVAGIGFGYLMDLWLRGVFSRLLPLPVWRTPFQPGVFARAAILGFVLPVLAAAIPVWRAVRVQPVDAIRTGHLAPSRTGLLDVTGRIRPAGRVVRRMPLRNLARNPRRTLLTALAIGAAITTMVATIGLYDSFQATIDQGDTEATHAAPDRLIATLDTFYPANAPQVTALEALPQVAQAQPRLRLFGTAGPPDDEIDLLISLIHIDDAMWTPTLTPAEERAVGAGEIALSRKAADDLGVGLGDTVAIRHPFREGLSYRMVTTDFVVGGIHPSPMRALAYLDLGQASAFNLTGLTNAVDLQPAPGVSEDDATRAVFAAPGVGSVQSVTATVHGFQDRLDSFLSVLRVTEVVVLALAILIAFNATSIAIDERARQHATMLAFGLTPATVLALAAIETALTGLVGTILGLLAGRGVVGWIAGVQLDKTMPDLAVQGHVSPATALTALALGVLAAALAPVLLGRRVSRMDVAATLRILE